MRALIPVLLMAAAFAHAGDAIRLSEPVAVNDTHETFGVPLPDGTPVSLSDAVDGMKGGVTAPVLIETEVVRVCQKKGCFFIARDGATTARVKFADYGFFVPTDSAGKRVVLSGTLERVELSPEQAAHYAEDLGEAEADPEGGFEIRIVATSVSVPLG